jgi:hypothetical protein
MAPCDAWPPNDGSTLGSDPTTGYASVASRSSGSDRTGRPLRDPRI